MPRRNPVTGDPLLDRLRAERERRDWSQQRLAEETGYASYQSIFNWESGANQPRLGNLRKWAGALGYDVALSPRAATVAELPAGEAYDADLRHLAELVNGFVYAGDRLEAVLRAVEVLRTHPDLAKRLLDGDGS